MKLAITGTRHYRNWEHFEAMLQAIPVPITMIVTSYASGVEQMARKYGRHYGIPVLSHNVHRFAHGKNWFFQKCMLLVADADNLLVMGDSACMESVTLQRMAKQAGKRIKVVEIPHEECYFQHENQENNDGYDELSEEEEARYQSIASRYGEKI